MCGSQSGSSRLLINNLTLHSASLPWFRTFVTCFIFVLLGFILLTLSSYTSSGYSPPYLILINALFTISLFHGFAISYNLLFGGFLHHESLSSLRKRFRMPYFLSCFIFGNCCLLPFFLKDNFSVAKLSAKEAVPIYVPPAISENACLEWGSFR